LGVALTRLLLAASVLAALCGCGSQAAARRHDHPAYLAVAEAKADATDKLVTLSGRGHVLRILGTSSGFSAPPEWVGRHSAVLWVGPDGLTVRSVDGGPQRVVFRDPACADNCDLLTFDLSPDGKTVLVAGVGPHNGEIVSVDFSTGKQTVLKHTGRVGAFSSTTYSVYGAWSPDGKSILYERIHTKPRGGIFVDPGTLVLARPDGSGGHVLLRSSAQQQANPDPIIWSWSPDGRQIVVYEQSGFRTLLIDPSDGRVRRLAGGRSQPYNFTAPVWAPDSRRLAVELRCTTIFSVAGKRLHRDRCISGGDQQEGWTKTGLYILAVGMLYRSDNGTDAPVRVFPVPKSLIGFGTIVPR
jgi:WD40-like Beta Propeller Repeat